MLKSLYKKYIDYIIKFWNKEGKYIILSIAIGMTITICVAFTTSEYSKKVSDDIANSMLRLHIRANSNEDYDQKLKLKVRDELLKSFEYELRSANSKDELINIVEDNNDEIISVCEAVIKEEGYNYSVTANVEETYIETRNYGNVYLPAGIYDALVIEIGEGSGDNWWCVLFPPLCYLEATTVITDRDRIMLEENLTEEEYDIITQSDDMDIKIKFKIVEFWGRHKA